MADPVYNLQILNNAKLPTSKVVNNNIELLAASMQSEVFLSYRNEVSHSYATGILLIKFKSPNFQIRLHFEFKMRAQMFVQVKQIKSVLFFEILPVLS